MRPLLPLSTCLAPAERGASRGVLWRASYIIRPSGLADHFEDTTSNFPVRIPTHAPTRRGNSKWRSSGRRAVLGRRTAARPRGTFPFRSGAVSLCCGLTLRRRRRGDLLELFSDNRTVCGRVASKRDPSPLAREAPQPTPSIPPKAPPSRYLGPSAPRLK